MTYKKLGLSLLVAISLSEISYAFPYRCADVIKNFAVGRVRAQRRLKIIEEIPQISHEQTLEQMKKDGSLIFKGNHQALPGVETLASNESDWAGTPKDYTPTDLLIGFATNSAWDIGFRKKAKHLVMTDWNPQPILAQSHIVAPLLKIATTPQELILMVAAIPPERAKGISLSQAFDMAAKNNSTQMNPTERKESAQILLKQLAMDSRITDDELQFLTSYFSPRIHGLISQNRFGPFTMALGWHWALLTDDWQRRYDPRQVGDIDSIFSSPENFKWLRDTYNQERVKYALADINDPEFYKTIRRYSAFKGSTDITLSVSNVFDCCTYTGTNFAGFQQVLKTAFQTFDQGKNTKLTVFRTSRGSIPHGFYRYELKSLADIPTTNEDPYGEYTPSQVDPDHRSLFDTFFNFLENRKGRIIIIR